MGKGRGLSRQELKQQARVMQDREHHVAAGSVGSSGKQGNGQGLSAWHYLTIALALQAATVGGVSLGTLEAAERSQRQVRRLAQRSSPAAADIIPPPQLSGRDKQATPDVVKVSRLEELAMAFMQKDLNKAILLAANYKLSLDDRFSQRIKKEFMDNSEASREALMRIVRVIESVDPSIQAYGYALSQASFLISLNIPQADRIFNRIKNRFLTILRSSQYDDEGRDKVLALYIIVGFITPKNSPEVIKEMTLYPVGLAASYVAVQYGFDFNAPQQFYSSKGLMRPLEALVDIKNFVAAFDKSSSGSALREVVKMGRQPQVIGLMSMQRLLATGASLKDPSQLYAGGNPRMLEAVRCVSATVDSLIRKVKAGGIPSPDDNYGNDLTDLGISTYTLEFYQDKTWIYFQARSTEGWLPLTAAIEANNLGAVRFLISENVSPILGFRFNWGSEAGHKVAPIQYAARYGSKEIFDQLLEYLLGYWPLSKYRAELLKNFMSRDDYSPKDGLYFLKKVYNGLPEVGQDLHFKNFLNTLLPDTMARLLQNSKTKNYIVRLIGFESYQALSRSNSFVEPTILAVFLRSLHRWRRQPQENDPLKIFIEIISLPFKDSIANVKEGSVVFTRQAPREFPVFSEHSDVFTYQLMLMLVKVFFKQNGLDYTLDEQGHLTFTIESFKGLCERVSDLINSAALMNSWRPIFLNNYFNELKSATQISKELEAALQVFLHDRKLNVAWEHGASTVLTASFLLNNPKSKPDDQFIVDDECELYLMKNMPLPCRVVGGQIVLRLDVDGIERVLLDFELLKKSIGSCANYLNKNFTQASRREARSKVRSELVKQYEEALDKFNKILDAALKSGKIEATVRNIDYCMATLDKLEEKFKDQLKKVSSKQRQLQDKVECLREYLGKVKSINLVDCRECDEEVVRRHLETLPGNIRALENILVKQEAAETDLKKFKEHFSVELNTAFVAAGLGSFSDRPVYAAVEKPVSNEAVAADAMGSEDQWPEKCVVSELTSGADVKVSGPDSGADFDATLPGESSSTAGNLAFIPYGALADNNDHDEKCINISTLQEIIKQINIQHKDQDQSHALCYLAMFVYRQFSCLLKKEGDDDREYKSKISGLRHSIYRVFIEATSSPLSRKASVSLLDCRKIIMSLLVREDIKEFGRGDLIRLMFSSKSAFKDILFVREGSQFNKVNPYEGADPGLQLLVEEMYNLYEQLVDSFNKKEETLLAQLACNNKVLRFFDIYKIISDLFVENLPEKKSRFEFRGGKVFKSREDYNKETQQQANYDVLKLLGIDEGQYDLLQRMRTAVNALAHPGIDENIKGMKLDNALFAEFCESRLLGARSTKVAAAI